MPNAGPDGYASGPLDDAVSAALTGLAGSPGNIRLGLDRMQQAMGRAGIPHRLPFPVILVAGTNGKGSTVAYLEALYRQSGYRTAAYTSPHVWRFPERLRINGQMLGDGQWLDAVSRLAPVAGEISLTYFELVTLAAVDLLLQHSPDLAILEIGLGGRADAVNAFQPDLGIITSVDLDHQAWLGNTRDEIGREKAGIFRPGVRALYGDPENPCSSVLGLAQAMGTPLWRLGRHFSIDPARGVWRMEGQSWRVPSPLWGGLEQWNNLALALAAVWLLREVLPGAVREPENWQVVPELPGRAQWLRPWGKDGPRVLADVAHNPQATAHLAEVLRAGKGCGRVCALWGMMADKDIGASIQPLADLVDVWYPLELPGSRAASRKTLHALLEQMGLSIGEDADGRAGTVLEQVRDMLSPEDTLLCFGSFLVLEQLPEVWFSAGGSGLEPSCPG